MRTRRALSGQVAIMFAAGLTVLLLFVGIGADVSRALAVKTRESGVLEAVSQSCMEQAMLMKYSSDPARTAVDMVEGLLEANRFTGTARVWYAEAPRSLTGASDRYAAVRVELEGEVPTAFISLAGVDVLRPLAAESWVLHPYATSGEVHRPSSVSSPARSGAAASFEMKGGATVPGTDSYRELPYGSFPEEVRAAVEDAIEAGGERGGPMGADGM